MIGETVSQYRVLSRLGAGAMGAVYEAEDARLGRRVAIKFLPDDVSADADAIQRFQREARVISSLNHPHICTLYEIGSRPSTPNRSGDAQPADRSGHPSTPNRSGDAQPADRSGHPSTPSRSSDAQPAGRSGHPSTPSRSSDAQPAGRSGQGGMQFMVMELLDGEPLKDRLARGPLAANEVLELGAQIADALEAAHAQGVVHRGIKPANLFVTKRGAIKVLDFGVAKLSEAGRLRDGLAATMGGSDQLTTIGTVAHMSPEQARGQEIDARSDLFSAGVVLYEMATGQLPFQGVTVATIFESLLTNSPMAPSEIKVGIPAELDRVILKALDKDRETRYQGAAELRADLKRLKRAADSGTATAAVGWWGGAAAAHGPPLSTKTRRAKVTPRTKSTWRKPVFIGAPLVTALTAAGFIAYRSINTPALTQKDSVVVSSVVNRTGDAMFDDTLGEALALQLRQSPFLNVVPEQQVQATLRLMGREPMTPITAELGREICQRSAAKALLGGTIAMLGSSYVLTLNAQDCVNGNILAEEQAQANSRETVLQAMGTAVSAFREQLGESLASIQRYDARIEEAATPSLEALKAYSQGLRTRRTTGDFDSVPFFRRAIDLDPQFALAYARLGTVYANLGQTDESRKMTTKAYELREKVSEAERYYIEARYYTTVQTDIQKALDVYNVWLATYPGDYTALANSALLHKQQGDRAEAIRKLELATKVAPDQPLAFTNLGQTYFEAGQYAEARRAYENSILLQDSTGARVGLYQIAILTGDTALADRQVAAVAGRRDEVDMVAIRMFAATYRGRMKEASDLAADFQARALALSRPQAAGRGIMQLAIGEALFGLIDQAKARVDKAEEDGILAENTVDDRMVVAAITKDGAMARQLLPAALEQQGKGAGDQPAGAEGERLLWALTALAEGKPAEAIQSIEPVSFDASRTDVVTVWTIANYQAGDFPAAVKGLTFLSSTEARSGLSPTPAFVYATLARVQVKMGQTDEARRNYQRFLDLFKDADPDLPLLVEVKAELDKLGS